MEGQFYACQKCGYQGNGTISYRVGTKACLWGLGLLTFTGVFWWIPCICDDCKDIDIYCGRCGIGKLLYRPIAADLKFKSFNQVLIKIFFFANI